MMFDDYMDFVGCDTDRLSPRDANLLGGMGMGGEGGEVCDLMKKMVFHGKAYSQDELTKELGDVLWYMTLLMRRHEITLNEVMEKNVFKLCSRHPDRYGEPYNWLGAKKPEEPEEEEDLRNGLTADGHPVGGYTGGGSALG